MAAGYVGLTSAACFADLGNDVCVVDSSEARVLQLRRSKIPFFEPGLQELVERNARAGRLRFTVSHAEAIKGVQFCFLCVPTPMSASGEADLAHVHQAAVSIAACMAGELTIVNKSTVPMGTGNVVAQLIAANNSRHQVKVVSNPEFLREGSAVNDFFHPDRIVLGSDDPQAAAEVAKLYDPIQAQLVLTTLNSAEMIKYASNAFLATRISFINEIARICDLVGADIDVVARGMGLDPRIGAQYLAAGVGFGGSCLPKDVHALAATTERLGGHPLLLRAVLEINAQQRHLMVSKLAGAVGDLRGKRVALLGLAFKPDTDDLRDAPALEVARLLLEAGATVRAYDPAAMPAAHKVLPQVRFAVSPYAAAKGADALCVVSHWNEFKVLDMVRIRGLMRRPIVVDGRNLYDPQDMRALGFVHLSFGRN